MRLRCIRVGIEGGKTDDVKAASSRPIASIISPHSLTAPLNMSRNHYETLGVRQSDTDASIRRAIHAANEHLAADASLLPAERESRLAKLQIAADALSTPANRDRYDASLRQASKSATGGSASPLLRAPLTWITLLAITAIASGLYWQVDREQTRQRVERQRVAAELQEERRAQEIETRRFAEKQRLLNELREQRDADDKQRQEFNQIRSADSQRKNYVVDDRVAPPPPSNFSSNYEMTRRNYDDQRQMYSEAQQREMDERKQRQEEDANLQRAKAEVDRQKRYLDQLEREDQYARARREAASQPPVRY